MTGSPDIHVQTCSISVLIDLPCQLAVTDNFFPLAKSKSKFVILQMGLKRCAASLLPANSLKDPCVLLYSVVLNNVLPLWDETNTDKIREKQEKALHVYFHYCFSVLAPL